MEIILLMVLFSTPDNPEPHMTPGYAPRQAETLEQCLTRRSFAQTYLESNLNSDVRFTAFCTITRIDGYEEAMDVFQRDIGDPT